MSELSYKEKQLLEKFKENVSDVMQSRDDKDLIRWLRARYWNPEAAEKMLRQSLLWRQDMELDDPSKTYKIPEPFSNYLRIGCCGYDKDKTPVVIWHFGELDVVGFLNSFNQKDLLKLSIHVLEHYLDLSKENGQYEVVAILDFDNFSIKPFLSKAAAECAINLVRAYEANYPETLKICYVINAPRIFAILYNMVKGFIHEATLRKIQIYRNNSPTWKNSLLSNIDPGNLPEHYGGTLRDPDGNPRCLKLIPLGGKIPRECYKNKILKNSKKFYTEAIVKSRDKLKLGFEITEVGSLLKWDFYVEEQDIRFGITFKDTIGETKTALEPKRLGNNQENESGFIECYNLATYTVIFDNSYSLWKNKKVFYELIVSPPVTEH